MEFIISLDNIILDFFSNINNPFLTSFMSFITHLGDSGFIWIVIGVLLLFFKKTRKCGFLVLMSLLVCSVFALGIMKPFFGRVRPFAERGITPFIPPPGGASFPSGHTSSSFAAAYAIFSFSKKFGIFAFILAGLIAVSRLYFLVHYPTDVLGGIIVGLLSAFLTDILIKKLYNLYKRM